MKSKSFDLKRSPADKGKHNKTFDFVSLYKSATENGNEVVNGSGDGIDKENSFGKSHETPRQGTSHNKKKKGKQEPLDISRINIEGPMIDSKLSSSPINQSKVTSTPRSSSKGKNQVKSIMKQSSVVQDDTMDESEIVYSSKSKKRNKSVSFMLEESDVVVSKKTKSEESLDTGKKKQKDQPKPVKTAKGDVTQEKKAKKNKKHQVDNAKIGGESKMETESVESPVQVLDSVVNDDSEEQKVTSDSKKQDKKMRTRIFKNQKRLETDVAATKETNNNEETTDTKKKVNKKKRKGKPTKSTDVESNEPAAKSRKKEVKPEVIAENLENLTIGDNPHTLTNLLDEMTVADKDRKKKTKRKQKKDKAKTIIEEEPKEKVKWGKKWNKAKKVVDILSTSVLVENLPLSLICTYKQVLGEQFEKYGVIKKIGVAEIYLNQSEEFTTTVQFETDTAATEALSEDGKTISGNIIEVKRPLPPTETTLVVRSYAPLSDQSVSTTFSAHGRIRNIRRMAKGKKAIETVFIEFDGPEAVERAIESCKGAKVGGKKLHVAKFEARKKKVRSSKMATEKPAGSGAEADSEDSND